MTSSADTISDEDWAVVCGLELRIDDCREQMNAARRLAANWVLGEKDRSDMAWIATDWARRLRHAELAFHRHAPKGYLDHLRPAIYRGVK